MTIIDSRNYKNCIRVMFKNGCTIKEIARYKQSTEEEIEKIIVEFGLLEIVEHYSSGAQGSKTEPYYETEEEMMNMPVYQYDELSKKEKQFYESRIDK